MARREREPLVNFRMPADDRDRMRAAAEELGMTVSEMIRADIHARIEQANRIRAERGDPPIGAAA